MRVQVFYNRSEILSSGLRPGTRANLGTWVRSSRLRGCGHREPRRVAGHTGPGWPPVNAVCRSSRTQAGRRSYEPRLAAGQRGLPVIASPGWPPVNVVCRSSRTQAGRRSYGPRLAAGQRGLPVNFRLTFCTGPGRFSHAVITSVCRRSVGSCAVGKVPVFTQSTRRIGFGYSHGWNRRIRVRTQTSRQHVSPVCRGISVRLLRGRRLLRTDRLQYTGKYRSHSGRPGGGHEGTAGRRVYGVPIREGRDPDHVGGIAHLFRRRT